MNIENLRNNYPKLITYMEQSGYCNVYVKRVKQEINRILSNADRKVWASYTDIYLEYEMKSCSKNYLHERLAVLGIIERFDVQRKYTDGLQRQSSVVKSTKYYYSLVPGLSDILAAQTDESEVIPEVDYEGY